ncbi:hypothetical protein MTR_1g060570 [Medicago truncatula]|uniref:Uncharacterized protein n=1 Tax=Medicago truncatula TaxID=3880 RepID=A0A072VJS1_MEDTR|nr:hypothetical protein MTR_1g060570 [Medicago truncatula]
MPKLLGQMLSLGSNPPFSTCVSWKKDGNGPSIEISREKCRFDGVAAVDEGGVPSSVRGKGAPNTIANHQLSRFCSSIACSGGARPKLLGWPL